MSCTSKQVLRVKRLHLDAKVPQYQSAGAAGMDIHCLEGGVIPAGGKLKLHTGLAFAIPEGFMLTVHIRSGLGCKHSLRLSNCTGIIDSDYRGELMAFVHNDSDVDYVMEDFERFAQIILERATQAQVVETIDLDSTERGDGGFGHSGRQ